MRRNGMQIVFNKDGFEKILSYLDVNIGSKFSNQMKVYLSGSCDHDTMPRYVCIAGNNSFSNPYPEHILFSLGNYQN